MLRKLYDWTLSLSMTPYALWALAVVSFAESSFFPIPPDILLIPLILAAPQRAFLIAGICTLASVLGGGFGYFIGAQLFELQETFFRRRILLPTWLPGENRQLLGRNRVAADDRLE